MDYKKINANLLLTMAILAALWTVPPVHAQPWLVRGTVTDASTGQPLPAATVQLAGTYRGTIANDEGEYSLKVQQLPATLTVSYIGYVSQERELTAPAERIDFALTPVPFLFDPIVVTAETSAEGIMRQVIRRKQEWRPSLASYQAQAYARRVLENEEGIVSIGELASEIYWERERGLREVVKSRRVTQNLDAQEAYISAFAGFANFYDDDIPFIGHTLIGPTHPDALKHYRFDLIGQRYLDDKVVFDISVEPKNKLQAAFVGRVSVLDEDFALLEVELAPSRATTSSAVPLPLIEHMDFAYQQQFRGFAGGVWLPVDYRASMAVKISTVGLHFPAIKYNVITRLSDCQVNVDMPDSLYASEEVLRVDSLAVAQDSSFVRLADKVPLSAREQSRLCDHRQHYAVRKGLPADGVSRPFVGEGARGRDGGADGTGHGKDGSAGGAVALGMGQSEARFAIRPGGRGASGAGGEPGSGRRAGGRCCYRIQRRSEALVLPGAGRLAADGR